MLRFAFALCGLFLLICSASSQDEKPPYQLPKLKGWQSEIIPLPPGFAKDMKWKGHEDLRFAPGMFKKDDDSFFSYTILFWLPGQQKIDVQTLETELLAYYRGLYQSVSKSKNKEMEAAKFSLKIKDTSKDQLNKRPTGETVATFAGDLEWVEPFVTGKPQILHMDIQSWYCAKNKHQCIFICVSPQQPQTAEIWKTMREIRSSFNCHQQ